MRRDGDELRGTVEGLRRELVMSRSHTSSLCAELGVAQTNLEEKTEVARVEMQAMSENVEEVKNKLAIVLKHPILESLNFDSLSASLE